MDIQDCTKEELEEELRYRKICSRYEVNRPKMNNLTFGGWTKLLLIKDKQINAALDRLTEIGPEDLSDYQKGIADALLYSIGLMTDEDFEQLLD
jgi:hypothetical protein